MNGRKMLIVRHQHGIQFPVYFRLDTEKKGYVIFLVI